MKLTGNLSAPLLVLLLAIASGPAFAAVQASLDRNVASLGDTLRLVISTTDGEDLDDIDLGPLYADFEVLQRSSSSNTSFVNGSLSRSKQLTLDITPRREGKLEIPPLQAENSITTAIPVTVGPAAEALPDEETVMFEAEVDSERVYVQGQLILTLRVHQAINLEQRGISEFKLDNAFVKPLEQRSYQRTANGRPWQVNELRYAIYPEQSGTLEIPAQVFSGRVATPRRSLFDMGRNGKLVRRQTQPLSIEVLPRPAEFTATTWLPVHKLTVEEVWSTPPEELRAGDSATRTLRILAEGAQGAQLPPIQFTPIDGFKYYPDQPQISEKEMPSGLLGIRQDSAALVPTRAGSFHLPEIRIPWWDVQTRQVRYAVVPGRDITVAAAEPTVGQGPAPINITEPENAGNAAQLMGTAQDSGTLLWPVIATASTLGWLLTLYYVWRLRRNVPVQSSTSQDKPESARKILKQLQAACASADKIGARRAVLDWAGLLEPSQAPVSLAQVSAIFQDEELTRELDQLDRILYSPGLDDWQGQGLSDCVQRLHSARRSGKDHQDQPLALYPTGG